MAFELAAGVVGVTSLAVQLAGSAQKLQTYCHDYSTAPKQVKELVEELQLVNEIIQGLGPAQDSSSTSGTVPIDDRCKRWCMSIRDDIASVLHELEQRFPQRAHKTKFKFVFKKERIGEIMGNLERAKSMLLLGRQLGQGEPVRRQLDDLSQQSTSLATGINGLQQSADAAAAGIEEVGRDVANIRASTSAIQQATVLLLPRHNEVVKEIRASACSHDDTAAQHSRILNNVQSDLLLANQAISAVRANTDSTEQVVAQLPRQFQEHQSTVSEHLREQRKANAQIFDVLQAWKQRSDHTSQSVERIEDVTTSIIRDAKRTEGHMARLATHLYGSPDYVTTETTTEQTKTRLAIQFFPPRIEYEYTVTRGSAVQGQAREASTPRHEKPRRKKDILFRIKLPTVFVQYQWGLCVKRMTSIWRPFITPDYIRDSHGDDGLYDLISMASESDLQRSLGSGELSIHDVDSEGNNLLHYVASKFNRCAVDFLKRQGLGLRSCEVLALWNYIVACANDHDSLETITEIVRATLDEREDDIEGAIEGCEKYCLSPTSARTILEKKPLNKLSNCEKVQYALDWMDGLDHECLIDLTCLEVAVEDTEIYRLKGFRGGSLLTHIARTKAQDAVIGAELSLGHDYTYDCMLALAIRHDDFFSYFSSDGVWTTSLGLFMRDAIAWGKRLCPYYVFDSDSRSRDAAITRILQDWVAFIQRLRGVDLEAYGSHELAQLKIAQKLDRSSPSYVGCTWRSHAWLGSEMEYPNRVFWSFNYGPNPEDWRFWFDESTDCFAGTFWIQLERRQRALPIISKILEAHSRLCVHYRLVKHECHGTMPGSWNRAISAARMDDLGFENRDSHDFSRSKALPLEADELWPLHDTDVVTCIMNTTLGRHCRSNDQVPTTVLVGTGCSFLPRGWDDTYSHVFARWHGDDHEFQGLAIALENATSYREVAVAANNHLRIKLGGCCCAEPPDHPTEPSATTERTCYEERPLRYHPLPVETVRRRMLAREQKVIQEQVAWLRRIREESSLTKSDGELVDNNAPNATTTCQALDNDSDLDFISPDEPSEHFSGDDKQSEPDLSNDRPDP